MNTDDLEKMNGMIREAVKTTVNGKIDGIKKLLEEHIKDDSDWKETAKPVIELGANLRGFGRVLAYVLATVAGLGGAADFFIRLLNHHK